MDKKFGKWLTPKFFVNHSPKRASLTAHPISLFSFLFLSFSTLAQPIVYALSPLHLVPPTIGSVLGRGSHTQAWVFFVQSTSIGGERCGGTSSVRPLDGGSFCCGFSSALSCRLMWWPVVVGRGCSWLVGF